MKKIVTLCTLVLALAMSITLVTCGVPGVPVPGGGGGGGDGGDNGLPPVDQSPINVSNEGEWITTVAIIKAAGSNKAWTINVTTDIVITGKTENSPYFPETFGSVQNITVTVNGASGSKDISVKAGTKYLIFRINAKQTVIINNISLKGNNEENEDPLVKVEKNGSFTMTGTASLSNNKYFGGGGAVVCDGNFIMQDSASIYGNTSTLGGGGVCFSYGTFTMKDSAKIYNNTVRDGGGGVEVKYGGTFIMQDNTAIYGNNSTYGLSGGGGVLVSAGTFTMKGNAKIYNNTAKGGGGGGVSVNPYYNGNTASFIMESGEIYGNSSLEAIGGRKGGGVAVFIDSTTSNATASLRIVSGTIYGSGATTPNTVETGGTGAALYVDGTGAAAQRGTFSGATWTSSAALNTTDSTIKVANGELQP